MGLLLNYLVDENSQAESAKSSLILEYAWLHMKSAMHVCTESLRFGDCIKVSLVVVAVLVMPVAVAGPTFCM